MCVVVWYGLAGLCGMARRGGSAGGSGLRYVVVCGRGSYIGGLICVMFGYVVWRVVASTICFQCCVVVCGSASWCVA